mmetsp:Transcript_39835/g.72883  ORF Transcript_39835/g.72883 Transcript_39835/m.72883 type:complete len:567 (-) Transcript_39835:88-1788(-)
MTTAANNMTQDISPRDAEVASSERDRIEQETERLQSEIAALKRLQKLKREEEELKRWLSGDRGNDNEQLQRNSSLMCESFDSGASSYPSPSSSPSRSGGLKKRGAPTSSGNSIGGYAKDKYDTMKKRFSSQSQGKKDDGDGDGDRGDVETQYPSRSVSLLDNKYGNNGKTTSRKVRTNKRGASGSAGSIPARILFRKIAMAILTNLDDETLQREDTEVILIIITLLKEAMLGILIAFMAVSFVLFIDHYLLLNLPMARNIRKATFAVMNDKETLHNFEVNAGLKFMEMEEYNSILNEIEQGANTTKMAESILSTRTEDLVELERDTTTTNAELQQELSSLGLDKFCDKCMWSPRMKITCGGRVRLLAERYQTEKYQAMMSAMQKESCRSNSVPMMMQDKKQESNELLQDWGSDQEDVQSNGGQRDNVNQGGQSNSMIQVGQSNSMSQSGQRLGRPSNDVNLEDFCGGCTWEAGTTCGKRSTYLNEMHGTDIPDAMAVVMAETKKCTNSFYEEELQKLGGFCGHCEWGVNTKLTCDGRVDYLTYTYRSPLFVAQLSAMEKPSCRLNK